MGEKALEHYKKVLTLYKNPFCVCEQYEKNHKQYQVYKIKDKEIKKNILLLCQNSALSYSIYKDEICIIEEYQESISLQSWTQENHTITERIQLCEKILFIFMNRKLPPAIEEILMDPYNLGVNQNNEIILFTNLNVSRLRLPYEDINLSCKIAELCWNVIACEKPKFRCKRNIPEEYRIFYNNVMQKHYQNYQEVLNDMLVMENAEIKKKVKRYRLWKILMYFILIMVFITVIFILFIKFIEWNNRTYNGLQQIGNEVLGI